jgi:hypothetical protein
LQNFAILQFPQKYKRVFITTLSVEENLDFRGIPSGF